MPGRGTDILAQGFGNSRAACGVGGVGRIGTDSAYVGALILSLSPSQTHTRQASEPEAVVPSGAQMAPTIAGDAAGVLGRALGAHQPELLSTKTAQTGSADISAAGSSDPGGSWRASIALLLRWTSPPEYAPASAGQSQPTQWCGEQEAAEVSLRGYLQQHGHRLEVLFIQRSSRDGDPWSGHIACPGGRRDADDADDFACAVRETREEIGLDLADTVQYHYLGRLDDVRLPRTKVGGAGVLSSFVFMLKDATSSSPGSAAAPPASIAYTLEPAEVAAALWVPVSALMKGSNVATEHVFALRRRHLRGFFAKVPFGFLDALGMTRLVYPAVDVFAASTEVIYADNPPERSTASEEGPSSEVESKPETVSTSIEDSEGKHPVLWGLTMRAVSDMVQVCGGDRIDRPVFVFDNKVLAAISKIINMARLALRRVRRRFRRRTR